MNDSKKNNIIYELEVASPVSKEQAYEDTPEVYRIEKADTASGIIIYGRYSGNRWIANPSCRELVAHLLRLDNIEFDNTCPFCEQELPQNGPILSVKKANLSNKKCYRFTEHNSWEGETWHFFIDMTDEQYKEFVELMELAPPWYKLSKESFSKDQVKQFLDTRTMGYTWSHEYLGELVKMPIIENWDDKDPFYKGRIENFCGKDNKEEQ